MFCDEDRLLHIVWAAVELERPAHATLRVNHICAIDRGGEYEVGNDDAPTRGMALNIESDVRVGSGDADLDDVGAVTGEVTRREPLGPDLVEQSLRGQVEQPAALARVVLLVDRVERGRRVVHICERVVHGHGVYRDPAADRAQRRRSRTVAHPHSGPGRVALVVELHVTTPRSSSGWSDSDVSKGYPSGVGLETHESVTGIIPAGFATVSVRIAE